MLRGSVTQYLAVGACDKHYFFSNDREIYENKSIDFSIVTEIPHSYAEDTIKAISFTINDAYGISSLLKDLTLTLTLDNINIVTYKLDLFENFDCMSQLSPYQYLVKIPKFLQIKLYPMLLEKGSNIKVHLSKNIGQSQLLFEKCWYSTKETLRIQSYKYNIHFQKIDTLEYNINDDRMFDFALCFSNHCTKGYFIECEISKISNIELNFNYEQKLNYNIAMINTFCVKISDTLLYVPLNYNMSYDDNGQGNYIGSFNHDRVDCVNCIITLNDQFSNGRIKIHSLGLHLHIYENKVITDMIPNTDPKKLCCSNGLLPILPDDVECKIFHPIKPIVASDDYVLENKLD
jgi:hypothetical protein